MTTRQVRVGKTQQQLITTTFSKDPAAKDGVREHVTLSTPEPLTDTQRLRLRLVDEEGKAWPPR